MSGEGISTGAHAGQPIEGTVYEGARRQSVPKVGRCLCCLRLGGCAGGAEKGGGCPVAGRRPVVRKPRLGVKAAGPGLGSLPAGDWVEIRRGEGIGKVWCEGLVAAAWG